jgi:hypothetical protein
MYRLKVRGEYVYYRCHGHLPQPRGCGTLATESLLDSIVDESMRANDMWVYEWTFEPGEATQIQAEIDRIRLNLRDLPTKGLSDDDEDAERERLRSERRELESQIADAKPDRWEKGVVLKDNGQPLTEAERWENADLDGRRQILKDYRVTFAWSEERKPVVTMAPLWAVSA